MSPPPESQTMPHWLRITLGFVFLVLGVAGLVLPVLQGVLFLLVSLALLSPYSPFLQRQEARLMTRFPRLAARRADLTERARSWLCRHGLWRRHW